VHQRADNFGDDNRLLINLNSVPILVIVGTELMPKKRSNSADATLPSYPDRESEPCLPWTRQFMKPLLEFWSWGDCYGAGNPLAVGTIAAPSALTV